MYVHHQGFSDDFEVYECKLCIEEGDSVRRQFMQAPKIMIQQNFLALMKQAARSPSPIRITLYRSCPFWLELEQRWIEHENSISFENFAWIDREAGKAGDTNAV